MRPSRFLPLLVLAAACGSSGPARSPSDGGSFRVTGIGASADPTIRSARLVPETVDENQGYGTEPGGGVRAITAGLRVVTSRDGAIVAADDRLPQAPQLTTALPDRLGGGFLFVLGTTVWRADHWLDPAKPIFASLHAIQAIVPGLDRVYVRAQNAYLALDGKTGKVLDLGPWPASPFVSGFAAADGWRAAAVTDLRGVVATYDAGVTWRALDLPMEPRQVLVSGDSLAVGGIENGKVEAWFEVRADGAVARLAGAPREAKGKLLPAPATTTPRPYLPGGYPAGHPGGTLTVPAPGPTAAPGFARSAGESEVNRDESVQDAGTRIFGKRPLAAAIEDGWPLTDGTAVVARDGALGRVRLSDGALTEVAQGAFPLKPSRCHPVSLTRPNAVGAFGFVCGEPRGTTVIYAYDPLRARLSELKRFDRPRVVTSAGTGALAVRGPCAEDGDASAAPREPTRIELKSDGGADGGIADTIAAELGRDAGKDELAELAATERGGAVAPGVHPYCVLGHDNTWREVHVRGDVGGERVVVLADGKVAVVSPPQGQTTPARLTLLEKGRAITLPVVFPKVTADVARALRLGVWLDGFEERRPGVLGGWIEAGGAMLGVEIALDGKATPGQFIRDAGMPFVSGRYGLGWMPSRRGFETTDGGMTWTSLEVPEPLVSVGKVDRRACGPIGCVAAGWLRVGWGEAKKPPVPAAPSPHRSTISASIPHVSLACEATTPVMPPPPAPRPRMVTAPPPIPMPSPARKTFGGPPVLATPGFSGLSDMPAFFAQPGPALRDSERGTPFEVQDLPERYPRLGPLARIYAWGPKTGDWDTQGKWQVKWLSPFAGWTETRASLPVVPPPTLLDLTKQSSVYGGYGSYYNSFSGMFQMASGDDSAHALMLVRRASREVTPIELEAERAPVEIRRADGEPFLEVDAVTRAAGRWFVATPPPPGTTSPVTTVWQVDGAVARELVRVSRAAVDTGRPTTGTHLARRSDGRAIGLVVDGQPTAERTTTTRWVLPIDLETGQLGEPELLGYSDLAGRSLEACTDDLIGWVFDASLAGTSVRIRLPRGSGSMHSVYARVRLTPTRACIERIAGMYDGQSPERAAQLARPGARGGAGSTGSAGNTGSTLKPGELVASAFSAQARYALRCTVAK